MTSLRYACLALLGIALAAGTWSDAPRENPPLTLAGFRVLTADFHTHTFPFSASTLAPWDLVLEARRQSLDVVAITGHNQVLAGKIGRWFSEWAGGPGVIVGEEVHSPRQHLIALGLHTTVSWHLNAADAMDEIHRQGGFAIAAHPVSDFWPAFGAAAMERLDGTEVMQPVVYSLRTAFADLQRFYHRKRLTAIGSSDYHGPGPLGLCRTLVFARDDSEAAILEALRAGRTIVYDRDGHPIGDPALLALASSDEGLRRRGSRPETDSAMALLSRTCGLLGLAGLVALGSNTSPRSR